MANADGSIVIDTKLDNTGFKSGSDKMKSAINNVQSTIDNFGKQTQASINSIAPALRNAAAQAQQLSSSLTVTEFQKNAAQMNTACESLAQKVENLKSRFEQGFTSRESANQWVSDFQNVEQEAARLQQRLIAFSAQQIKSDSLTEMEKEAEKLEAQLEKLYARRDMLQDLGVDESTQSWKRLQYQIRNTEADLERTERGIETAKSSGSGYTDAGNTEQFQSMVSSVQQATSSMDDLSNKTVVFKNNMNQTHSSLGIFSNYLTIMKAGASGAKAVISGFGTVLSKLGSVAGTAAVTLAKLPFQAIRIGANAAKTAFSALSSVASTMGGALKSALSGVATMATSAGKKIASLSSSMVSLARRGLSTITSKTNQTSLSTNTLVKSLTSVKRMLLTRVKRMFISEIFKSVQASLQNLAKYSSTFNQSMSNIKNSAKTLGGNLAVTFGNLLNTIAPAITTICNWLSTAISYLNSFFALLQGKTSVMVAKKSTDDYAKSLNSASKAAKDLNHQVYGFDELTKQESDDSSGSSSNGGASYEEQDIGSLLPESIMNLFNSIKDAIANQNWREVGSLVADGLNWIVTKVDDWILNVLKPFGVKWAGNIAEILNGLVDNFDFDALGKLLADGLNTVLEIGDTFLTTFDWGRLGEQLANGVNSLFNNVDWELLGKFFADKLNALFETAATFLSNLDWGNIGSSIATAINSWFTNIDWDALVTAVTSGVNGLVTSLETFVTTLDWSGIATTIGEKANSILTGIDWGNLVYTLTTGVLSFGTTLLQAVRKINWSEIASSFASGINKIFGTDENGNPNFSWDGLVTGITNSINGLVDGVRTFVEGLNWEDIATTFGNKVNGIISNIDWANMIYTLALGVLSLGLTLAKAISLISWSDIALSFSNGINKIFGTDENGNSNFDWDGLTDGITKSFNGIVDGLRTFIEAINWTDIATTFSNGINSIISGVDWANLIVTLVLGVFTLALTLFTTISNINWSELATKFADGINQIFKTGENGNANFDWDALTEGLTKSINGIVDGVRTFIEGLNWADIATTFSNGINSIISGVDWANLIITLALGVFSVALTLFTTISNINWSELASKFADGINGIFKTGEDGNSNFDWDALTEGITKSINGIVDGIRTFIEGIEWSDIATTFSNGINGLISGINWTNLIFTLALGLYSIVNTILLTIGNIDFDSLGKGLADGLNKVFGKTEEGNPYINWAELGQNFGTAVKNVIHGIDTFVTETDWKEIGISIADALGNIDWVGIATHLIGLLWDALWGAVELLGGFTERLMEIIFGTKEDIVIPDVFSEEVEDQLKEQAGEAGEAAAWEMYQQFINTTMPNGEIPIVADLTGDVEDQLTEGAQQAVIAAAAMIGTGYQDEMCKWLEEGNWDKEMAQLFSQKSNDLFSSISLENATVESVKAAFSSAGIQVSGGFAEAITGTGAENIGAALMLLGAGVDQDTIAMMDGSKLHENLMAYMNETGLSLTEVAEELATNTGEAMGRLLPEGMQSGLEAGEKDLEAEVEHIEDIASTADSHDDITEQASDTGSDVDTKMGEGITDNLDTVTDATGELTDAVEKPVSELPDNLKPYADYMMQAVTQAIVDGDPLAVAAIEAAAKAVVDKATEMMSQSKGEEITKAFINGWNDGINNNYETVKTTAVDSADEIKSGVNDVLSDSNGYDIGEAFLDGIDSGLLYNASPVVTDIEGIGEQILSGIQDYLNYSNGETIGENVLIGMINGFNNYGQTLVDTMAEICSTCIENARAILGIASPSKVFREIGSYTMEGMQIGLEDTGETAIQTVSDIAQAMTDEAESGNGIHLGIDAVSENLDTAENKLAQIADIFAGIADSLAEMGGLTVPGIAMGQVIPYAAEAAGNATSGAENTDYTGIEDALFNAISRAQDSNSNEEPIVIKLVMDGREISDVVTKYQRRTARAWG